MLRNVSELLENDIWKGKRIMEVNYFNAYCDGNNSKILVQLIKYMSAKSECNGRKRNKKCNNVGSGKIK